jgi:hypothetical protein
MWRDWSTFFLCSFIMAGTRYIHMFVLKPSTLILLIDNSDGIYYTEMPAHVLTAGAHAP